MPKKALKLVLALAVLAGGLIMGIPAREASAAGFCQDLCCDRDCTSIRRCFRFGGSCVCEQFCEPHFPEGEL